MGQDRLKVLAVLTIHKDEIKPSQIYNDLVVEYFAAKKTRRAEYLYIQEIAFHILPSLSTESTGTILMILNIIK